MKQLEIALNGEHTELAINLVEPGHRERLESYQKDINRGVSESVDISIPPVTLEEAWHGGHLTDKLADVDPFWERGEILHHAFGLSFPSPWSFIHAISSDQMLQDAKFHIDDEEIEIDVSSVKIMTTAFKTLFLRKPHLALISGTRISCETTMILPVADTFDPRLLVFHYEDYGPYGMILKSVTYSDSFQGDFDDSFRDAPSEMFNLKYIAGAKIEIQS